MFEDRYDGRIQRCADDVQRLGAGRRAAGTQRGELRCAVLCVDEQELLASRFRFDDFVVVVGLSLARPSTHYCVMLGTSHRIGFKGAPAHCCPVDAVACGMRCWYRSTLSGVSRYFD